jgi:hypothetical protein
MDYLGLANRLITDYDALSFPIVCTEWYRKGSKRHYASQEESAARVRHPSAGHRDLHGRAGRRGAEPESQVHLQGDQRGQARREEDRQAIPDDAGRRAEVLGESAAHVAAEVVRALKHHSASSTLCKGTRADAVRWL